MRLDFVDNMSYAVAKFIARTTTSQGRISNYFVIKVVQLTYLIVKLVKL